MVPFLGTPCTSHAQGCARVLAVRRGSSHSPSCCCKVDWQMCINKDDTKLEVPQGHYGLVSSVQWPGLSLSGVEAMRHPQRGQLRPGQPWSPGPVSGGRCFCNCRGVQLLLELYRGFVPEFPLPPPRSSNPAKSNSLVYSGGVLVYNPCKPPIQLSRTPACRSCYVNPRQIILLYYLGNYMRKRVRDDVIFLIPLVGCWLTMQMIRDRAQTLPGMTL